MASVTLTDLSVALDRRLILDRISLDIGDGTFASIVGPSGTGKTTLLRAIAGLTLASHGSVAFDGRDVTRLDAGQRDIGMVFQTPSLLPNRNVRRNVEFPLELRRQTADAIRDRVSAEARAMHIEHLLRRRPAELSRGEEQLVQIARTMVRSPRLLLLDEPFAPLDAHLRNAMRSEIRLLQAGYGVTTIMATNDPADAMSLASLMAVLIGSPSRIVQYGAPRELRDEPATLDVATTTGPLVTLSVMVEADATGFWLDAPGALRLRSWAPALHNHVGRSVTLGVRPEHLVRDDRGEAEATLKRVVPGAEAGLICSWGGLTATATGTASRDELETIIRLRVARAVIFENEHGDRIA